MNRRGFIQRFGLLAGGAFISLQSHAYGELTRGKKISGKVVSRGKGIANVVISDGFSVVVSDKKGKYSLTPNALATNIFMSTPAGYAFNTNVQVARHYEKLGSRNAYDFNLLPLNQPDDKHHFIIWADPQVRHLSDVKQMVDTTVPDVQQLVKSMGADALIHGICVGDIIWDNHAMFDEYNKAVAQMGIPFFQVLGNHDMDYNKGGDETSDATFKEIYGPTYYSFNRGKAHYVVLDDVRYLGTKHNYDGYISEEQLRWLAEDLKYVKKDQLLIINVHIPIHSTVKNNADFYALLAGYKNVHVMSGHTHYNKNVWRNEVYEHNHGAVCGAWWTGSICEDGTPRGYGVYEVTGNDLKWYYKSTGQDQKIQVSASVEELTNQKRVIANVWNWDPQWKVEYFLDDVPMGIMENQKGFDPLAVKLYKGPALPVGLSWPEPRKTEHLFMAHFNPSVKTIRIEATDRFGEKFTAHINSSSGI